MFFCSKKSSQARIVAELDHQKMRLVILPGLVITHQTRTMFVHSLHEQLPGYVSPNRRSENPRPETAPADSNSNVVLAPTQMAALLVKLRQAATLYKQA